MEEEKNVIAPVEEAEEQIVVAPAKKKSNASVANDKFDWDAFEGGVVSDEEKAKIMAELEHQRGFLAGVRKKLGNETFVAHAPAAVVENERKKEADAIARISALESSLAKLQ